jgi:translation elongation factor EF-Tu-like GTPase
MPDEVVGKVSHFFPRPMVVGIDLVLTLKVGDKIHIKGHTTDFEMTVDSMQIDNRQVDQAGRGDAVGIKASERAREGDVVYRVME